MTKRKHRKQPKGIDPAASARTKELSGPKSWIRLQTPVLIFFLVLAILGIFASLYFLKYRSSQSEGKWHGQKIENGAGSVLQSLSHLDFTGMEPQVVEKIKTLQKEVLRHPQSAPAWGRLAMNLDVHDLKTESILCYKQAAVLDPNEFRWPYYCAIVLYESGSPEAIPLFERSLNIRSNYAPAHLRYGQALFQAKRLEEAAREFNKTLEIDPKSSHAYLGLARIALINASLQAARTNLQKALELNREHREAHGLLAEVYRRLNMQEEAQRELVVSQQLPKKTALQDVEEAELYKEGVSSYWYEIRGRAYLQQGSYEAAITELKKAVQASPDPRLHDLLGVAYLYLRQYSEAMHEHRAALALNPTSVRSMNNLASALFEMGQTGEAISWLKKAIQLQPTLAYSYSHLGGLYLRTGQKAEAILVFRRGHEQLPRDPQLALRLAWLLATASDLSLRNGTKAVQLADAVCKEEQYRNPESLDVLAAAYAEGGELGNATKYAEKAYRLATASGQTELANRIQVHKRVYEGGHPYHE
jgi:tetratricopeptide (TPR) repeat protein